MWIEVLILFELHILQSTFAFEDCQADLTFVLIVASQPRYGKYTFENLPSNHSLFAQTWRNHERIDPHASF